MQFEDSLHFLPLAQLLMKFTLSANKSTYFWYIKSQDWYVNQSQVYVNQLSLKKEYWHILSELSPYKKRNKLAFFGTSTYFTFPQ